MLQVRVHYDDVVGVAVLQTGVHRSFLAEVARERDVFDVVKLRCKAFHYEISLVLAAVVDENIAEIIIGKSVDDLVSLSYKVLETFLLVITWNNQIYSFHMIRTFRLYIEKYYTKL